MKRVTEEVKQLAKQERISTKTAIAKQAERELQQGEDDGTVRTTDSPK